MNYQLLASPFLSMSDEPVVAPTLRVAPTKARVVLQDAGPRLLKRSDFKPVAKKKKKAVRRGS